MIEKFELNGNKFKAEITKYKNPNINYFGKYKILIKDENEKIVAGVQPSETFLNGFRYPHKAFLVSPEFRKKGIANWIFEKSKELNEILELECVPVSSGLDDFYIKRGYKIAKKIKDRITNIDWYLLNLDK